MDVYQNDGREGLTRASKVAILNANYIAQRLDDHFPVVFRGVNGTVAHECIINLNEVKKSADISVDDIAKRLIDYGTMLLLFLGQFLTL